MTHKQISLVNFWIHASQPISVRLVLKKN